MPRQAVHQQDECRADAVDCDTGEQKAGRREWPPRVAAPSTNRIHTGSGEAPAQTPHDAGDRMPVERDGEDGAERGSDGARPACMASQRIAQHRLKQAARQRQRAARERPSSVRDRRRFVRIDQSEVLALPDPSPVEVPARTKQWQGRTAAAKQQRRSAQSTRRPIVVSISITDTGPRDASRRVRRSAAPRTRAATRGSSSAVSVADPCHAPLCRHDQTRAERSQRARLTVVRDGRAGRSASPASARRTPKHLQLLIDVEKCRGLVEQQQTRSLRQTGRQEHPLALAAAERGQDATPELEALAPAASPPRRCPGPRRTRTSVPRARSGPSERVPPSASIGSATHTLREM